MDDKKNKKEFINPDAEIVDFTDEDIITMSVGGTAGWGGEDFGA